MFSAPIWTKTENLRAEAQITTLAARINYMAANFVVKMSTQRDHPDHALTALYRHHEGHRGQGKWIEKAASILTEHGVRWQDVLAATAPTQAHERPPWTPPPMKMIINPPPCRKQACVTALLRQHGLQNIHEVCIQTQRHTTQTDR